MGDQSPAPVASALVDGKHGGQARRCAAKLVGCRSAGVCGRAWHVPPHAHDVLREVPKVTFADHREVAQEGDDRRGELRHGRHAGRQVVEEGDNVGGELGPASQVPRQPRHLHHGVVVMMGMVTVMARITWSTVGMSPVTRSQ